MRKRFEEQLDWLLDFRDSIWRPVKWAWQRLTRGWDDRIIWSIDYYLARMLPIWLSCLKEVQHGYPDQFEDSRKWNEILDVIIGGFESAKQIQDHSFSAWDLLVEQERERYGRELDIFNPEDRVKMDIAKEKSGFWGKLKAQENEALERFRQGMALFTEYFFDLWD